MAGEYLIAVEGDFGNEGGASFAARVVKVAEQLRPLVPGNTVTGTFDVADRTRFTLTLTQPRRLLCGALSSHTNLPSTLTGPRGLACEQPQVAYSEPLDLASGLQPL